MTDLEITRLCAQAMFGDDFQHAKDENWQTVLYLKDGIEYDPLHDDAQAMALVKKLSINIHHHGCADHKARLVTVSGHWDPYSPVFKVSADDFNRAICECVAKMQAQKPKGAV